MKHLLIICSLLLTSVIWSEDIEWSDLVERNGVRYKKFSDVPFTGKITSGIYQGELIDGKNEGEWIMYHENGTLLEKINFKNNKIVGCTTSYHDKGQLWGKGCYDENGMRTGKWVTYREDGSLWRTSIWKDGKTVSHIDH